MPELDAEFDRNQTKTDHHLKYNEINMLIQIHSNEFSVNV